MVLRGFAVVAVVLLLGGCGLDRMLQRTIGVSLTGEQSAAGLVYRGEEALRAGRPAESIRLFEKALAMGGRARGDALYGLALARLSAGGGVGGAREAKTAFETLVQEYPDHERRPDAAVMIQLIEAASRERARAAALQESLGGREEELERVRAELEKKEEALENLRKALLKR